MSVSRDDLLATIKKLKQRILEVEKTGMKISEQDTRQGLINPLFRSLGWDFSDFTMVKSEFRHPKYNEVVDYALFCGSNREKPVLLLEAKPLGQDLSSGKIIKQICAYMGEIGVQWGLLSDGNKYVMYNSNAGISFDDQRFITLQLKTADTEDGITSEELADKLIALLSYNSLENDGIQKFYKEYEVNRHIEDALWSLLSEPFDTLAGAIKREFKQERVKVDPRLRISTNHIIAYLEEMKDDEGRIPLSFDEGVRPSEDSLLQEVAVISQQQDPDASVIKHTKRVTIAELLAAGLVQAGDNWRTSYKGEMFWGRITTNGEIEINGKFYTSPSAASVAVSKGDLWSGWNCWRYKNAQGEWRKISTLREQYRHTCAA